MKKMTRREKEKQQSSTERQSNHIWRETVSHRLVLELSVSQRWWGTKRRRRRRRNKKNNFLFLFLRLALLMFGTVSTRRANISASARDRPSQLSFCVFVFCFFRIARAHRFNNWSYINQQNKCWKSETFGGYSCRLSLSLGPSRIIVNRKRNSYIYVYNKTKKPLTRFFFIVLERRTCMLRANQEAMQSQRAAA